METGDLNLQITTKAEQEAPGRKRTLLKKQEGFPEVEMHALWDGRNHQLSHRTEPHNSTLTFAPTAPSLRVLLGVSKRPQNRRVSARAFPLEIFFLPRDLGALQTLMTGALVEEQEGAWRGRLGREWWGPERGIKESCYPRTSWNFEAKCGKWSPGYCSHCSSILKTDS